MEKKSDDCQSYSGSDLDKELSDAIDDDVNELVTWYILSTYARDVEEDPILSEGYYSRIKIRLMREWNEIKHDAKDCISLDSMTGTLYIESYPARISAGIKSLREAYKIGTKYRK